MHAILLSAKQPVEKIGIYPGAFKPPHVGHYIAMRQAAEENDLVFIVYSGKDRDGVTEEKTVALWKEYLKGFHNVHLVKAAISPVRSAYEMVEGVNKSEFASQFVVSLYTTKEDEERYKRIHEYAGNLKGYKVEYTPRVTSATEFRSIIKVGGDIHEFIPACVDTRTVLSILNS